VANKTLIKYRIGHPTSLFLHNFGHSGSINGIWGTDSGIRGKMIGDFEWEKELSTPLNILVSCLWDPEERLKGGGHIISYRLFNPRSLR